MYSILAKAKVYNIDTSGIMCHKPDISLAGSVLYPIAFNVLALHNLNWAVTECSKLRL